MTVLEAERRSAERRRVWGRVSLYFFALAAAFLAAFPFLWGTITMFKQDQDLYRRDNNPFWFNESPTLEHIQYLFTSTAFTTFVWNTLLVGLAVVTITLAVALPAAYSLARLAGRWGERMGIAIFLVYLIPPTLLFLPMSRVIATLDLHESLWSLVLVYPTITIPISVWLLMGFFKGIPRDIEEQAMVDGYTRMGAFRRAVLPLAVPGILTVVVFAFTLSTSEFVYALTFVQDSAQKTVSIGIPTELVRGDVFRWGPLLGGALVASIPVAILYTFFIDHFVAGLTAVAGE